MLTPADFRPFFAALNGGNRPFAWQERLLGVLVSTGKWPDAIAAPTGTGKSSVVDIHTFANALFAVGAGPRVARRLSVVVNRRAIVDQHQRHAMEIQRALLDPERPPVIHAVREALAQLAGRVDDVAASPLSVVSLRGGQPLMVDGSAPTRAATREWLDDPRRCSIICATPDMWGSRVLFRGYGTSLLARPRAAGLLAMDSAVIIDEAHLSRQLVITARDIAGQAARGAEPLNVPALQVVSSTATQSDASASSHVIGVEEQDVVGADADPVLQQRLLESKTVRLIESRHQPQSGKASASYVKEIVSHTLAQHRELRSARKRGTVGVILNHVSTAARVAEALGSTDELEVVLWVGRMRPMDLDDIARDYPGIFSAQGCDRVDVLVTTQTAEVGVDLDFPHMVTELAPAASLAQRFGRVNRRGLFPGARVDVLVPQAEPNKDRPPYRREDLASGYRWLRELLAAGGDASPWALSGADGLGVPEPKPTRLAWSRVRPSDADLLGATSVPQFQEPDLAFWLRDDLDEGVENVGFAIRDLPDDDALATALICATLPSDREILPVPIGQARAALARVLDAEDPRHRRFFPISSDDDSVTPLRDLMTSAAWLRPGATVVLDADHRLYVAGVVDDAEPTKLSTLKPEREHPTTYMLVRGTQALDLIALDPLEQRERATQLLGAPASVKWSAPEEPDDGWAVLELIAESVQDEGLRQVWSPSARVLLEDHCAAVGERVRQLGQDLGLPDAVCEALEQAGLVHDAGKADLRFQRCALCNDDPRVLLAKGISTTPWEARRRRAGMPARWRHEQLSAALAWTGLSRTTDPGSRNLIVRLAGTSHGWGRPFFPHGSQGLTRGSSDQAHIAAASELFDSAEWQEILGETRATFGDWGCAYLEALLRAADGAVSREGR